MSTERWEVGPILGRSWELFTRHLWVVLGAVAVMAVTSAAFSAIDGRLEGWAGHAGWSVTEQLIGLARLALLGLSWAVNTLLTLGSIRIYLKAARGEAPRIADLFGEGRHLVAGIVASLVTGLGVAAGAMLLVVPGVILMLGWMFSLVALVDQGLGPMEAIRCSWRITSGEKGGLLLWTLVCLGLMVAGLLACGVGIVVALPVCGLGTTLIYLDLLERSDEGVELS